MAQVLMSENWAILHIFKEMGTFGQLEQGGLGTVVGIQILSMSPVQFFLIVNTEIIDRL